MCRHTQGHWGNLLNLEFEPAIGHVGPLSGSRTEESKELYCLRLHRELVWGPQELPVVAAAAALDQHSWLIPGAALTSYSPLSTPTWRLLSQTQGSLGKSPFFTLVWRKLHTKSEPRAKATCAWKSACTLCTPKTRSGFFKLV